MKLKVLKGGAAHIQAQETAQDVLDSGGTVNVRIKYEGEWYVYYDMHMPAEEELMINDFDSELPQIMDEYLNETLSESEPEPEDESHRSESAD